MENMVAKFVSQKISKTRWRPVSASSLQQPDVFAAGSWDNEIAMMGFVRDLETTRPDIMSGWIAVMEAALMSTGVWVEEALGDDIIPMLPSAYSVNGFRVTSTQENKVSIWSTGDFGTISMEEDYLADPKLLCDIRHKGDVMDLQFLDQDRILTASSTGTVTIFRYHQNNQTLSEKQKWEHAHHHAGSEGTGAPCTSVVCNNPEIVSVGEDGRINLFRVDSRDIVRAIDDADSSTMHAVNFLRTTEILTVNSIGQLKMWDLRLEGNDPTQIFSVTNERVPLHCLDRHPSQQHVVATGGHDGMLCIWDVRQSRIPISLLNAHGAEMWEVHFHPSKPDHLFTCSEDGSLWHWDASTEIFERQSFLHGGRGTSHLSRSTAGQNVSQSLMTTWLSNDPTKGHLEINNLLPSSTLSVNSLDVLGDYLVCGTDAEAIYVTKRLFA